MGWSESTPRHPTVGAVPTIYLAIPTTIGLVVTLVLRYGPVGAIDGADPIAACRQSVRVVARHPARTLVEAVGSIAVAGLVVGVGGVALEAILDWTPFAPPLRWIPGAVIGIITIAGFVVLIGRGHRRAYDRWLRPVAMPALDVPLIHLAVAGLIVGAVLAGGTAIRVADPGSGQGAVEPLPDDPAAALSVARTNTYRSNREVVWRNQTSGEVVSRLRVDVAEGRIVRWYVENGTVTGSYTVDGVWADLEPTTLDSRTHAEPTDARWRALPVLSQRRRPRRMVSQTGPTSFDLGDSTVVERTDDRIVYRVQRWSRRPLQPRDTPRTGGLLAVRKATFRVVIDRETGQIDRLVGVPAGPPAEGDGPWTIDYRDVRSTDVDRPDALGPRGPIAWLWDAIHYHATPPDRPA